MDDTLYRRRVNSILHRFLTHDEPEGVINDCHRGAHGGHFFGLSKAQKILRVGYFWPSIFRYCVNVVKKCHPYQVFACNMRSHLAPLHTIVIVGPFTKSWLDFMD